MTVIKKQVNLQEESNRIQDEANRIRDESNTIQRDMVNVIKTYNKTTSRHNRLMVFLTIVIIALTFATLWNTFLNQTGRYALAITETGSAVLDTKTSQLWVHSRGVIADLGTVQKPKGGLRKLEDDKTK